MINKNYPYLNDKEFLDELFHLKVSTNYTKITLLNWNEDPIQEIQGKVVSGNFSFDGSSSLRRTGNLTIALDNTLDVKKNTLAFSINKKINLEIGIKNTLSKYIDYKICWFPLGIYIIAEVSFTHNLSELNMSLQLKDKMCLLNGQCGGTIPAATVFDTYETIDQNGDVIISRPTIYQIIMQVVNHFGGEDLGRIAISDIEDVVKQVVKWTAASPLYFLKKNDTYQMTVNEAQAETLFNDGYTNVQGSPFEYGYDVGFIYTKFTYPGDLICEAGAAVTDVLNKITAVLGNYEYFYDVNGIFRFQEIKNYLNNSQTHYVFQDLVNGNSSNYLVDYSNGKTVYDFYNASLISSFNNVPQFGKIKNDFIVWGIRETANGLKIPIRYHLAIDKKPKVGNTYRAFSYTDPEDGIEKWHCPLVFNSVNELPQPGTAGVYYRVGNNIYTWGYNQSQYEYILLSGITLKNITTTDWRTELYFQGVMTEPYGTESNYYYQELVNEWPKIYDIEHGHFRDEIVHSPTEADYFLDFIDSSAAIGEFSVDNIGRRSFVVNKNQEINCVFEPQIPDIIFINTSIGKEVDMTATQLRDLCQARKQDFYQISEDLYSVLSAGGTLNSGYQFIRQLLHEYTSYNENVSISCLPIYTLEPNTRISIYDEDSQISGDYMIKSLSFSLDSQSAMSINATRAIEKI